MVFAQAGDCAAGAAAWRRLNDGTADARGRVLRCYPAEPARLIFSRQISAELSSFIRPDHKPGSPDPMPSELGLRNVTFEVGYL